MEQQAIVEDFGKQDSNIRLLLCSDAGSQGVNLHFFCNRMFNYDIPWSLITLEQRNGRIDRYGQTKTPYIHYLVASSHLPGLKTDLHIINKLTEKEEVVYNTLGDAGSLMKLYDAEKEARQVVMAISRQNENYFEQRAEQQEEDEFALFAGASEITEATITTKPFEDLPGFYPNDGHYYRDLFEQLITAKQMRAADLVKLEEDYIELTNTAELYEVLYDFPAEARPKVGGLFYLSRNMDLMQQSITDARKRKGEWAKFQVLYELHPVVRYHMTKLEASVPKEHALAARCSQLPQGTAWFITHGQVSNNLGQPVISDFAVVPLRMDGALYSHIVSLGKFISQFQLQQQLYTEHISPEALAALQQILPDAIDWAGQYMMEAQQNLEAVMEEKQAAYEAQLQAWKQDSIAQLELEFEQTTTLFHFIKSKKEKTLLEIETILGERSQYNKNLMSLRNDAYIKILAVFFNQ